MKTPQKKLMKTLHAIEQAIAATFHNTDTGFDLTLETLDEINNTLQTTTPEILSKLSAILDTLATKPNKVSNEGIKNDSCMVSMANFNKLKELVCSISEKYMNKALFEEFETRYIAFRVLAENRQKEYAKFFDESKQTEQKILADLFRVSNLSEKNQLDCDFLNDSLKTKADQKYIQQQIELLNSKIADLTEKFQEDFAPKPSILDEAVARISKSASQTKP
ncbi:MAG: hypothetical protein NT007_09865 [Candidatus Kapabacteria bacterium]|nr:hypothetical protein [Candidatus Kapabacteria bacterium]